MGKVKIKVTDLGKAALFAQFKRANNTSVRAGVVGAKAKEKHPGSDLTNAELAAIHEFGTTTIPRRSFVAEPFKRNADKYRRGFRADLANEVKKAVKSRAPINVEGPLNRLGEVISGDMRQAIADGIDPPLAPSTIARKGSTKQLIATGALRNSISYEVVKGDGKAAKGKRRGR